MNNEQNFMVIPQDGYSSLVKGNTNFFSAIRPAFSFQYTSLIYIANRKTYMFEGQTYEMNDAQKAEVATYIASVNPDPAITAQAVANQQAKKYLAQTDWYVIRSIETGVPVPEDITAARAAARANVVPL